MVGSPITVRDAAAGEARVGPSLLIPTLPSLWAPGWAGARAGKALRELSPQTWRFLHLLFHQPVTSRKSWGPSVNPWMGRLGVALHGS